MRRILFSLIIIIALLGNINIAEAQYAHPATAIKSTNGNVQSDLNTLQANIASNTAEIEAINQNLATHDAELASITAEINLMSVNLGTIEIRLDSIETNILSMIEPAITELRLNLSTIEDLINSNYNSLFANLETHETELNDIKANIATHETSLLALQTNDGTQETRIESNEVGIQNHLIDNIGAHTGSAISYTDTYSIGAIELQSAIDTVAVWLNSVDLRLGAIELILAGGSSGEVLTKTDDSFIWETIPAGVTDHTLLSNIGTKTHAQLELDIASLQANPAGISRVYVNGVALLTGEVEFVAGANINLNVSGSTVEIESTASGSGSGATVEAILNKDYTARAQGTAETGFYSIYDFDITSSIIVTGTVVPTINGLVQYETTHFTIGTWDDSGTNKLRITFANDVSSDALVRVSCFTTLPLLAVISADNVSTTNGWLQDDLDSFEAAINDRYTKAESDATIEAAIAAIPTGGGTAIEDIGTYIESNTTWEFDADYDTTAVLIYRNRLYQPRSLFTTVDVASKTRVVFNSTINASDEIILISNK